MPALRFYGHACFGLETTTLNLLIDPWLSGNPELGAIPSDLRPPTHILVTHNHRDHVGDAIELSKTYGAPIITTPSAARHYKGEGAATAPLHLGGRLPLDGASVKCVNAIHDSPLGIGETWRVELGAPCGFVVDIDKKSVYHAGDTALFGDMALFAPVDVALLPIDGRMVMEPADAVRAAQLLQAGTVVPMHWRDQDPHAFVGLLTDAGITGHVMKNGETREL
ncbi:metal-dependent hydrolase [Streptomyces halstedii]|uniref:metal-dependent hydrolase n=1 Tax=Streptomyces TaxID=1883 RepID=UPI0004A88F4B|nr:metal-dependent hydrolase [Streptomyces sp. NTK 937]KDQ71171.1 hypothetical protein DT87_29420 [Streptomyces sp. NTK 937]WSX34426.1 metal-dependent hydrolase [Streptomyces halstedii]